MWALTGVFRICLPPRRGYYLRNTFLLIENKIVYKSHFTTTVISVFLDFPKFLTQESWLTPLDNPSNVACDTNSCPLLRNLINCFHIPWSHQHLTFSHLSVYILYRYKKLFQIKFVKIAILPKGIYWFHVIPIKILMTFSTKVEEKKKSLKSMAKTTQSTKNNTGGTTRPNFKFTTKQWLQKKTNKQTNHRSSKHWNRIENSKTNIHYNSHWGFHQGPNTFTGWKKASSTNGIGENWLSTCRRIN